MAFSKELEEIIEAALADGMITDKERAVLHRKAQQEGVDPDEVDVVIDGRLAKMKREVDWLKPEPPRSIKRGNVEKCPHCGLPIVAGSIKCECGYVFTNVKVLDSIEEFFNRIQNEKNEKKANSLILNFPVPTTKEDIMEFLYIGIPNSRKKGNILTTNPYIYALIGGAIGFVVSCLIILPFCDREADSFLTDFIERLIGSVMFLGNWIPIVGGGYFMFKYGPARKSTDYAVWNERANAWKAKTSQVLAKGRIVLSEDPDFKKLERMAKENGI